MTSFGDEDFNDGLVRGSPLEAKAKVVESREKKRKLARNGPLTLPEAKTQSLTLKKEGVSLTESIHKPGKETKFVPFRQVGKVGEPLKLCLRLTEQS